MSSTSAVRLLNPGGVARGRARCAHLSFPSVTVFCLITSPGHRTQHTHHVPPGIISSRLASFVVCIPRTYVRVSLDDIWCLAARWCTCPSLVSLCFAASSDRCVVWGRLGGIFFLVPSSRLRCSQVSSPPTSAKSIITIINNNIVINNNMSYNPTYVLELLVFYIFLFSHDFFTPTGPIVRTTISTRYATQDH